MGLILEILTDHGLRVQNAYLHIAKNFKDVCLVEYSPSEIHIIGRYNIYRDKEARYEGLSSIMSDSISVVVQKEILGNPYTHLYDALKQRYPGSLDD